MFERNRWSVCRKILIIAILSGCLYAFTASLNDRNVYAAACIQDCEINEQQCFDQCLLSCGDDDTDCNACILDCKTSFQLCMHEAEWCSSYNGSNTSACTVYFGQHCPLDANGNPNYQDPNAHSAYFEVCNYSYQCVECPHASKGTR